MEGILIPFIPKHGKRALSAVIGPNDVPSTQGNGGNQKPGARDLPGRMRCLPNRQNHLQEDASQLEHRNRALRMSRVLLGVEIILYRE